MLREVGIHLAEDAFASTDLKSHLDLLGDGERGGDDDRRPEADRRRAGGGRAPLLTLRELAGEHGDIGDPVGQGEDVYRACRDEITRCLDKGFDRLLALRG